MNGNPPDIVSDDGGATAFGGPSGRSMAPGGASATRCDDVLTQFLSPGTELPPELLDEQRTLLLRPGDLVAGRFEVVKLLGFGGMGAVYHVKDRRLGLNKAMKVMLPSLLKSETAQKRFLAEVAISQQLRHENIVAVYDLAADTKRRFYFFTMEYVPGVTLNRHIKERGGRLPVEEVLKFVRQICAALQYAHQYTVHRDLKPQNIMVCSDGRIKLLDFGLAKVMSPGRMTKSSMALGTAYYQAPEQSIHLAEADRRADIYSLGVILYQMLTGDIPVGRFLPPSRVARHVPESLDEPILKCLEPKMENRHESAAAFIASLDVDAGPRPKRPLTEKRAAIWVLAVVLLVAAAVFGVFQLSKFDFAGKTGKPEPAPKAAEKLALLVARAKAAEGIPAEPVKFDERIFMPGRDFTIEQYDEAIRYERKNNRSGHSACLWACVAFSAELENGSVLSGRAVLRGNTLSEMSGLVRVPRFEDLLLGIYADPTGLLVSSYAVPINKNTIFIDQTVVLVADSSPHGSTTRGGMERLGVASGGLFSGLSGGAAPADPQMRLDQFVFATTCRAELPYGIWEQTGENGYTLSLRAIDPNSPLDCILYYYLNGSTVEPLQTSADELTLGDLVPQDIIAQSNIIASGGVTPARDWRILPAKPLFAQAATAEPVEAPAPVPTQKLVEELPDGSKRLVVRGDPNATQRAQEEWMQVLQSQPARPSIQELRTAAKQAREEAGRIEAQRKQAELDRASAEHYEKWKGYNGAAPSIR